jgi:hypothetical protein
MKKVDPRVVAALGIMVLTPSGLRLQTVSVRSAPQD